MTLRVLEMLVGNIFVFAASAYVFRRLRTRVLHLDIPIFLFIFLYTATLYTFILGLAGLLEPHKMALISILGLGIFSIPAFKHRERLAGSLRVQISSRGSINFSKLNVLLLALLQFARILFHVWYIPPHFLR